MWTWSSCTHLELRCLLQVATLAKFPLTRSSSHYRFSPLFTALCRVITMPVSSRNWSEKIMRAYRPNTSINNAMMMMMAMSSLSNMKSPQTQDWLQVPGMAGRRLADELMMFVSLLLSHLHNDLIKCRNVGSCEASQCACRTLPHQRMPLKSLCISLRALPYISRSPKCFFLWKPLLFLAPLFHLLDCLSFSSPPPPASVSHTDSPTALTLSLFFVCLPPSL